MPDHGRVRRPPIPARGLPSAAGLVRRPRPRASLEAAAGQRGCPRSLSGLAVGGDAATDDGGSRPAPFRALPSPLARQRGLGYYSRARNLLAAARILAAEGFPADAAGWQRLPGVGPYTAAAIAAIAFGDPVPVVDTNVERVAARLFAIADPPPRRRLSVAQALRPHVPPDRPGDFAQALMDLGATVCTPRTPFCMECPLAPACVAHHTGRTAELPAAAPRRPRPLRHGTAWWIEVAEDVALVRRPPRGLLGGMLALPGSEWTGERLPALPFPGDWQLAPAPVRHGFTHFELVLHVAAIRLPA
ncbi:MAG: NUDIX domain-containing protein, partial [Sphingomonadaceae bacterium]